MTGICDGRVVIITGGAHGIGRGHAMEFAREGARVVVADQNEYGARAVADEIGGLAIAGDIAGESGNFARPARATIGRLPQEAPGGPEQLIDVVLAADGERTAKTKKWS